MSWPTAGKDTFLKFGNVSGALLGLGFEIARSNPTVTNGDNPMSEWIETLVEATDATWRDKGMRSVTGGLSEWFDGFNLDTTGTFSEAYNARWPMIEQLQKAIDYAGRLLKSARAIGDESLKSEVKKADFLSHLVNLGGAYSSFIPGRSDSSGLFLETIKNAGTAETLVNGVSELEVFLKKYDTGSEKEDLRIARNTLRVMSNIPTGSVQQEIRNPLAVRAWMQDVLSHAAINKTLQNGESIFDPSGLYEMILKGEGNQTFVQAAQEFYAYALPSPVLVASVANNLGTLAQEGSIGREVGKGIWWIGAGIFGGVAKIIVNGSGKIVRVVFSKEEDSRTEDEKIVDDAIAGVLEGKVPTDSKGRPLKPGQKFKEKERVDNFVDNNGDQQDQIEDIQKLADEGDHGVVEIKQSSNGTVRVVTLLTGQVASAYPKATSTKGPSTQIETRVPNKVIKIRYEK
ncbi:MAG: hypothetical protein HC860_17640 [Alkalinema sp. RU_4_3]|nr:hypothetical protein [Alkalinema sp. RU_4_3]